MILRDVDNIKVGSTSVNKVYQGNYKVYDKNKKVLEGYCKQDGIPTPDNPVEIEVMEGKQVVNVSSENMIDITTLNDGYVTPLGNIQSKAENLPYGEMHSEFIKVEPNTAYTFKIFETNSNYNNWIGVGLYMSNDYQKFISRAAMDTAKNNWITFTTTADTEYIVVSARNLKQATKIMLYKGSTATPYVPYKSQDFEVDLESKNLIDILTLDVGYVGGLGNILTNDITNGVMHSEFIEVEPNTTYRFKIFETSSNYPNWFGVGLYSSNDETTFIERQTMTNISQNYIQINTTSTTNYIRVSGRNLAEATKIMLYEGTEEIDYEPYYNYKLAGIGDYKDNIYTKEGKWYVKSLLGKVVLDGSENSWGMDTTKDITQVFVLVNGMVDKLTSVNDFYSNYFTNQAGDTEKIGIISATKNLYLALNKTTASTVAELKAWLSTHNTEVYYVLATPTEEEITSPTLIQQLNRLYQAM